MNNIEEIINQADILYNKKQYNDSKKLLTPLLEENMSDVITKLYLKVLFQLREYDEAIKFSEENIDLLETDNEFVNYFIEVHLKNGIFLDLLPYIKEKVKNNNKFIDYIINYQKNYIKNNPNEINKLVKNLKHLSNCDNFMEVQKIVNSMQKLSYDLLKDALSVTLLDEDLNLLIRNTILIKLRVIYYNDNLNVLNYSNEIISLNPSKISGYQSSKFMNKINIYLDKKIAQGELDFYNVKEYLNEEMKLFYPFFDFDWILLIKITKDQVIYGNAIEYIKILKSQDNSVDKIIKLDKMEEIFQIIENTKKDLIKQFN